MSDDDARIVWDSAHHPKNERFEFFHDAICKTFLHASISKPKSDMFSASVESVDVGNKSIGRLKMNGGQEIFRTKEDIAKIKSQHLLLYFQCFGESVSTAPQYEDRLHPQDLILYQSNIEFHFNSLPVSDYEMVSVLIDRAEFAHYIGRDVEIHGLQLNRCLLGPALVACMTMLNQRLRSGSMYELAALSEAAVALLAASVLQNMEFLQEKPIGQTIRGGMLMAIKRFVDQNPANSQLSPSFVAAQFGVSVRYVHKLFAENGTSFQEYVISKRLESIHADLVNPLNALISTAQIAMRWGFIDLSNFHRRFKAKFEVTPGELRRQIDKL